MGVAQATPPPARLGLPRAGARAGRNPLRAPCAMGVPPALLRTGGNGRITESTSSPGGPHGFHSFPPRRLARSRDCGRRVVRLRALHALAGREGCRRASGGVPHARPAARRACDDPLERAADSLHRSGERRRRGVRARLGARPLAARPDGDDADDRARARVGDDRPARRRHRPRPAHPGLRPRRAGDRAHHGRRHPALGPALRGRHQPLPGQRRRAAARLRRSRPGARALDGRGRVRHGAPRRHGCELAGLGRPSPPARARRLGTISGRA